MAKPRVFISSTFYDLKQVREDLERFIKELDYEPVRYEKGNIPHGKDEPSEVYIYKEIELCDIIVSLIGGRFGDESQQEQGYSISQVELRKALEKGIQVFIFIERNVASEFSTYELNKENPNVRYRFVDDVRVYEFIESLNRLPSNNPITTFETSADITSYLKAQWAGLFQRFLKEQKRIREIRIVEELKSVAGTLQQLVNFLTEERANKDAAIQNILLANHPAFRRFAEVTNTPYRVFFYNKRELDRWIRARGWESIDVQSWDEGSITEWSKQEMYIKLTESIFDDQGSLKIYTESDWNDDWVQLIENAPTPSENEIPF